jgi:hypothetical protein
MRPLNPNTEGPAPFVKFRADRDVVELARRVADVRKENLSERLREFLSEYARNGEREVLDAEQAAEQLLKAPKLNHTMAGTGRKPASTTRRIKGGK